MAGSVVKPHYALSAPALSVASKKSWRETRSQGGMVRSFSCASSAIPAERSWKVVVPHGVRYRDDPNLAAVHHPVTVASAGTILLGDENATNWLECDNGLWLPIKAKDKVLLVRTDKATSGYSV